MKVHNDCVVLASIDIIFHTLVSVRDLALTHNGSSREFVVANFVILPGGYCTDVTTSGTGPMYYFAIITS